MLGNAGSEVTMTQAWPLNGQGHRYSRAGDRCHARLPPMLWGLEGPGKKGHSLPSCEPGSQRDP